MKFKVSDQPEAPPASPPFLTTLTCLEGPGTEDDMARQIKSDLAGKPSILEMLKEYMTDLKGELDNDALPFRKLRRLFAAGHTPVGLDGHHYGVAIGLRTGDLRGLAAGYGNLLGFIWGAAIGSVSPWVGKSLTPMDEADRRQVVGDSLPAEVPAFRGINHFNVIQHAPVNLAGNALLNFMWQLNEVSPAENQKYGHERNGGNFAAYRAPSVYAGTPREVFRLNYRFATLNNHPPLTFLIDELVTIADGLYLGQLLFATARLLERYDPAEPDESYRYHHFGYFVIFDERWNAEAKRLFPHLDVPSAAAESQPTGAGLVSFEAAGSKFTTLTLADPPDGDVDPGVLNEVKADLARSGTVIRMLKSYADEVAGDHDTRSPVFTKLHTLFNAGIAPTVMDGFYRGALVSWLSQGLLAAFDFNSINVAWQATRCFSPWMGKRFYTIGRERLSELTDGHEKIDVPTFFCANTVVFRTAKERFVKKLMRLAGVWMEEATTEETRLHDYDAKTFFFIGKLATSVLPANRGKTIFQFNYRWKNLRNLPPDSWCIDELVQIAEGLFLGELLYATDVLVPWDPNTAPARYKYKNFGYFLLMDEEWHARRLRIGFDLENI